VETDYFGVVRYLGDSGCMLRVHQPPPLCAVDVIAREWTVSAVNADDLNAL